MSTGELILTALIALFVFGPDRLPVLARQLGTLIKRANQYKQQCLLFLDAQQQLEENQKKARQAEEIADQSPDQ